MNQGLQAWVDTKHDVAPTASIPTVGTTFWDVLLPAEGDATVSSLSGSDRDGCLIDETIQNGRGVVPEGMGTALCRLERLD